MTNPFFEKPILNSPYGYPARYWELDKSGQPTQRIIEKRRPAEFITPIPKPKKQKGAQQESLLFDDALSTQAQQHHCAIINSVRAEVDRWRALKSPADWRVTPETGRLLQHWRHHDFSGVRPFFCQVEAVETAIWLNEVAPQIGKVGQTFIDHLEEGHLQCIGGTYPAQLKYKMLAGMAAEKITAGITRALVGTRPIRAVLDPYNPTGSTAHVNLNTSKTERWETSAQRCHLNWVILDSGWEAEFCRVAEAHPRVRTYVKNHNLGLEVPYRYGSEVHQYRPDFIVRVDDGRGEEDLLNLVVEIKGFRGEDAKVKKETMEVYWVPGVNNLGSYGRWAFAEFTEVYQMQDDFAKKVEAEFDRMVERVLQ